MALTKLNFSGSGLSSLPNGSVIQTVTSTKTDSFTDTKQTNFVDIPNLAVTITPSSTANEVMIMYRVAVGIINGGYVAYIRLLRGSTNIAQGTGTGSSSISSTTGSLSGATNSQYPIYYQSMDFIDAPSTTSATIYKLQARGLNSSAGAYYINQSSSYSDSANHAKVISTITAMEIKR